MKVMVQDDDDVESIGRGADLDTQSQNYVAADLFLYLVSEPDEEKKEKKKSVRRQPPIPSKRDQLTFLLSQSASILS